MAEESAVPREIERLAAQLVRPRPMRRGSVSERWMTCAQSACACSQDDDARHGPYYSLTWAEGGQTRSRLLAAEQVALVRQQIEADREFRQDAEVYRKACAQWADAQLTEIEEQAVSAETAQKGGSKKSSRRRSSPRSKR